MYDDLLGPRKEKKKIPYDAGCDQENSKPAQPEKFDSHRSTSSNSNQGQDDDGKADAKDHWADVDLDVDEIDLDLEDLIDDCNSCDDEEATDPA